MCIRDSIYIGGGDAANITIRKNTFVHATGGGIHFYHPQTTHNVLIYDNLFVNNFWGVIVCDGAHDVHIFNNTFYQDLSLPSFGPPAASVQTNCGSLPAGKV